MLNYAYTPQGQLSKVWTSGTATSSPLEGEDGGGGVLYEYFYDPAGRLIEAKTPSGSVEYAYPCWRRSCTPVPILLLGLNPFIY